MTEMNGIARRDLERLSAFLDGELSPSETERLEARLATDQQLSSTLEALRATAAAVRSLPEVRPPRSFVLTDEVVRPRRAYPILQLSTAVAAFGFVLVVGADLLLSGASGSSMEVPEQAFFAADQLVPEAEQQLAAPAPAEAPAEAPALEGAIMEEAESEIGAAAEPDAEAVGDEDLQGLLRSDEAAVGEEPDAADQEAPAEEDLVGEGALKVEEEPEPSADELITDEMDFPEEEPSISLSLLRVIEIGLAAVLIVLVGLTLWVRQRG